MKNIEKGKRGSFSVGFGALNLLHPLLLDALEEFRSGYPEVRLSMFELATSDQP